MGTGWLQLMRYLRLHVLVSVSLCATPAERSVSAIYAPMKVIIMYSARDTGQFIINRHDNHNLITLFIVSITQEKMFYCKPRLMHALKELYLHFLID